MPGWLALVLLAVWFVGGFAVGVRGSWNHGRAEKPGDYDDRDYEHRSGPHADDYFIGLLGAMFGIIVVPLALVGLLVLGLEWIGKRRWSTTRARWERRRAEEKARTDAAAEAGRIIDELLAHPRMGGPSAAFMTDLRSKLGVPDVNTIRAAANLPDAQVVNEHRRMRIREGGQWH